MTYKTKSNRTQHESGFALLMTLIVVGVVLSVGLSILDLSIKQVRLASNAKDSEIAFHSANAGVECARYISRKNRVAMFGDENDLGNHPGGLDLSAIACFGNSAIVVDAIDLTNKDGVDYVVSGGEGKASQYIYDFTWGPVAAERCTVINTIVINAYINVGSGLTVENMDDLIPGYPKDVAGDDKIECPPGSQCTIISSQGYNKPCSARNSYGTVQREVLLQF